MVVHARCCGDGMRGVEDKGNSEKEGDQEAVQGDGRSEAPVDL